MRVSYELFRANKVVDTIHSGDTRISSLLLGVKVVGNGPHLSTFERAMRVKVVDNARQRS